MDEKPVGLPDSPPQENPVVKKVRKSPAPRAPKPAGTPLALPMPTRIDGLPNTLLVTTIRKAHEKIILYDGKVQKLDLVKQSAGSAMNAFIAALIDAVYGGSSLSNDGSCAYVAENWTKVRIAKPHLEKMILVCVPKSGGLKEYRASVSALVAVAIARASIVNASKSAGVANHKSRMPKNGGEDTVVDI